MAGECVDSLVSVVGVDRETAVSYLETVGGCLEDACYLDYCVSGTYPELYDVFFGRPLPLKPSMRLTILSATPPSNKSFTPQSITRWQELSWPEMQQVTEEHRRNGQLRSDEFEKCAVCLTEFTAEESGQIVRLGQCKGHYYHKECISSAFCGAESLKCPVCGYLYGVQWGGMPPGTFDIVYHRDVTCDGFQPGSWVLDYHFSKGLLPSGQHYTGTSRTAVLPDTEEGREVLRLLICAFYRRQTFVVGTSVTTGKKNTVVWNGIHHKTSTDGGPTNFGYPDPTYFARIKEELAARGIGVKSTS